MRLIRPKLLQVFLAEQEIQPHTPTACNITVSTSRNPLIIYFDPAQAGLKVWLFARWINTRGQAGGWSDELMFVIP